MQKPQFDKHQHQHQHQHDQEMAIKAWRIFGVPAVLIVCYIVVSIIWRLTLGGGIMTFGYGLAVALAQAGGW